MTDWRSLSASDEIRLAVLGDPIQHSLSPIMHQAAMAEAGIAGDYMPIKVRFNEFEDCIAHLASIGFLGVNVTIPHKESAAKIAPGDPITNLLSAANTLKFSAGNIEAKNTDVAGFLGPITGLQPKTALVLGAGGAAAAAVYALSKTNWKVKIYNRSQARAEDLALKFGAKAINHPSPEGCSLVVNATPLGLSGDTPKLEWKELSSDATIFDMAYRKSITPLLMKAQANGCKTIDGREMLVEQGAESFEWWFDKPAPRDTMRNAVGL